MFKNKEYEPGTLAAMREGVRWREELDYGQLIKYSIAVWFTCQFVLQAFEQVGYVLAFGILYSLVISIKSGGNEVSDGAEEFSFSLAAPRPERFKAKFLYGFIPLVVMLSISLLTIRFNLSQWFWSLFVETGLNGPYTDGNKESLYLYGIGLLVPVTLYICIFSATIISWGASWITAGVFKALFFTGLSVGATAILYNNMDPIPAAVLSFLLLLIVAAVNLHRSFVIYSYKEGHSVPKDSSSRGGVGGIMTTAVIILVVFIILIFVSSS